MEPRAAERARVDAHSGDTQSGGASARGERGVGASVGVRLAEALLVRPGEGRRTSLLFLHLFLASSVFVMGRTVHDTLFLSRTSIAALPWMFVLYGVASAITVLVYAQVADRLPRERAIVVWSGVGIVTYLATWVAVRAQLAWIYPTFYVWSEVFANLAISQFWTLANELHDPRSAKRLFGTIGAARVLGVIVVGLGTGVVVRALGTEQLLFVLVGLLVAIAACAMALAREPRPGRPSRTPLASSNAAPKAASARRRKGPGLLDDPYVWALSAMILCAFAALTIGDYQFKAIARQTYREDSLAQFFSYFYAGTGLVSFVFQLVVTPRLLARLGVGAGLSVMPSVFGAASAFLLGVPILPIATVMKFADNGFQYTIHDTTMQALYVPFSAETKVRTRAFLDAVVKPMSYGLGGALLLVFASWLSVQQLSLVTVVLVAGWALAIPVVRTRYRAKLESTLSATGLVGLDTGELGAVALDAEGRTVLEAALHADDPRRVLAALDEAERVATGDALARPEAVLATARSVARLVGHASPAVRVGAMSTLRAFAPLAADVHVDVVALRDALADPIPEVRAAAAGLLGAFQRDDANDSLVPLLDDDARSVRTAALAELVRHGGLDGALVGGARLLALAESSVVDDRADAASVLGALGSAGARRLRGMLDDADPRVRRAAAAAARSVADPRLVEPLVALLRHPSTESSAAAALAAMGPAAAPKLVTLLRDPATERRVRLALPRILRDLPCTASWEGLVELAASDDSHLRLRAFAALSRLRARMEGPPLDLATIRAWLEREILETYANLGGWENARRRFPSTLLEEAIEFRGVRGARRVLRILELRYAPEPLRLVRERIEQPAQRANALEVLDNTLEPALRPVVMPFFDDVPIAEKLARAGAPAPLSAEAFLAAQCRHPNPFVVTVALHVLAESRDALTHDEAQRALTHRDPMVREAAVLALVRTEGAAARALVAPRAADDDAVVRRVTRRWLEHWDAPTGSTAEVAGEGAKELRMDSTIEKLLALRAAPVFAKLRSEDLAVLARVAEIEALPRGAVIFSEGEMGDALFVVVHGAVEIRHDAQSLATLGEGEAFGEMAVLDAAPRSATAVAAEDVELLRIGSEAFYEVLHEQVEIAEGIIRTLSARLREANEAIEAARLASRDAHAHHDRDSLRPRASTTRDT